MKQKEENKPSKLIQEFYEQGRHQDDIYEHLTMKQITLKLNYVRAAELSAIAKVFNMPLSGLISEIIEENIRPMIYSLEKSELIEAGVFYEDAVSKIDLPDGFEVTQGNEPYSVPYNEFQEALDNLNSQEAK